MTNKAAIEYIAACLVIAGEEMERMKAWKRWEHEGGPCPEGRVPNKALIKDNLRNAARMAFRMADEI